MSLTLEALGRLTASIGGLPRSVSLPEVSSSHKMVISLGALSAKRAEPVKAVLEALRARLGAAAKGGLAIDVPRRDLQNAPWILWQGTAPAAEFPGVLEAVVKQAMASSRTTRNLIEAWIRDFTPTAPTITVAGHAIKRLLAQDPDPHLDFWREAERQYDLFDARQGPQSLARALIEGREAVPAVLAAAGLDDTLLAAGGYMRATLHAILAGVPGVLRGGSVAGRLARVLETLSTGSPLRFGRELHGEIGRALLGAWADGGREPDGTTRDTVRNFLLQHLGDPRLRAPNWNAVGEQHTAIMRRWLARASLKAFFDLIAEHALDRQWRFREAFWSACLDKGGIDDAWLALGNQVHWNARSIADLRGAFGKLEGGGVAGDQSVLLMRIGPLTVCDWSHNGKLRAWPREWANAPALHRASYSRDDLTGKGLPFPPNPLFGSRGSADGQGLSHVGSDSNKWQGSAAELLARKTNLRLTERDWRPR